MKLLYVEDSEEICLLAKTALADEGIEIECVGSLKEAHAVLGGLTSPTYDLLLVDLLLPDADGVEAVEALAPHCIPMIVVSGISDKAVLEAAAKAGAADYLVKTGLTQFALSTRIRFVYSRHTAQMSALASTRTLSRRRLHRDAFEALKPFISCQSHPPFAAIA